MVCGHHKQILRMDDGYVELVVHNLETADRTEDEGKNNFEEPSVWDKVQKTEVPKGRGEDGLQEVKIGEAKKSPMHRGS
jgi:hypothetical protein